MLTKETMDNIEFDIRLLTTEYLDGTVWPINILLSYISFLWIKFKYFINLSQCKYTVYELYTLNILATILLSLSRNFIWINSSAFNYKKKYSKMTV